MPETHSDTSTISARCRHLRWLLREEEDGDMLPISDFAALAGLSASTVRAVESMTGSVTVRILSELAGAAIPDPEHRIALAAWLAFGPIDRIREPTRAMVRRERKAAQRAGATS